MILSYSASFSGWRRQKFVALIFLSFHSSCSSILRRRSLSTSFRIASNDFLSLAIKLGL